MNKNDEEMIFIQRTAKERRNFIFQINISQSVLLKPASIHP